MWCSAVGCTATLILSLLVMPLLTVAQPAEKVRRIGLLRARGSSVVEYERYNEVFRQGLHDLGYVEGQTIILEERWAEGQLERLPDLAAELVRLQVEVIVVGGVAAARAARQTTQRIPIVVATGDALGTGLITNLARPGGNITGLTTNAAELSAKWLELLKEVVPTL
jgi:putative ABC transport system substrate-binding protein